MAKVFSIFEHDISLKVLLFEALETRVNPENMKLVSKEIEEPNYSNRCEVYREIFLFILKIIAI